MRDSILKNTGKQGEVKRGILEAAKVAAMAMKRGGRVKKTAAYKVYAGEYVVPAKRAKKRAGSRGRR